MALFERLRESRALSYQTIFRTGLDTFPARPESGFFVDADSAMRNPAVWAAQRLIAGDVSTLPVEAFAKDDTGSRKPIRPKPSWIEEPDPFDPSFTRVNHFGEVVLSILQDGNSFTFCEPSVLNPVRLEVLRPNLVQIHKPAGQRTPTYTISDARGHVVDELTPLNIIHIAPFRKPGQLRGLNPIEAAAEGIGISLAAERYTSRYFLNGASMPGFIKWPGDMTQPQLDEADKQLRKAKGGWRNAGVLGHLTGGADYVATGIKPVDSDLSSVRAFQIEEICRIYGVPPHLLGVSGKVTTPASVEQIGLDYIAHGLRHYVEPIEIAYRRLVPGDASTYLKFNFAALLRGELVNRYTAYNIGIRDGFLSIDDVRRLEDMSPVPGGDVYRVQAQMTDITKEPDVAPGVGGNVTGGPLEPASPAATQSGARELEADVERRHVELVAALSREVHPAAVNVHAPITVMPSPTPSVTVNVPEQRVADITVQPSIVIEPPSVTVNVPEQRGVTKTIQRDAKGAITRIVETPED